MGTAVVNEKKVVAVLPPPATLPEKKVDPQVVTSPLKEVRFCCPSANAREAAKLSAEETTALPKRESLGSIMIGCGGGSIDDLI